MYYQSLAIITTLGLFILLISYSGIIINLVVYIWDMIYSFLAIISKIIVKIMNLIISPNKKNGNIKISRLILWLLANITLIMIIAYFFDKDFNIIIFSSILFFFHILIIVAKLLMIDEDNLVMEGFLHKNKAKFRGFQAAIPMFSIIISGITIFLCLSLAIFSTDKLFPGTIIEPHLYARFIDYAIFVLNEIPFGQDVLEVFGIHYEKSLKPMGDSGSFIGLMVRVIFGILLYSAIVLKIKQIKKIKLLISAFESNDCDIQYLQQRVSHYPSVVKKKFIDWSIHHPNSQVRHRVISVMPYAQVVSFPQTYIYNLHKEKDPEIKEWGTKNALKLVENSEIFFDENNQNNILKSIKYQRKKPHPDRIHNLLSKIESKIKKIRQNVVA